MKKLTVLLLVLAMVLSLAACGAGKGDTFKVGAIILGDATEGYSLAHIEGIQKAAENLGLEEDQIVWKYHIPEGAECYDAVEDLVGQGCSLIFSNSYGHQSYMAQAAEQFPDVTFVAMTGDTAAVSGLENLKNAFCNTYESRYVSGVVAGMKLQELIDNNELPETAYDADGNIKIGYVGAFNYSEVVSGYTAFFLGIRSIVENVAMEVQYTNSWFDIDAENKTAKALIANGCVIIGQHADSTGAPAACEEAWNNGTVVYSIGYNIDMLETAPNAALTSAQNDWSIYYTYAMETAMAGEEIATDWAGGYAVNANHISPLGTNCAEGTAEKVAEVEAAIKDGTLKVFDTSKFTASGEQGFCTVTTDDAGVVSSCLIDMSFYDWSTGAPVAVYEGELEEAIVDGCFSESTLRAAPYFSIRIDGITEN